jgi:hypothetical protein
VEATNAALSGSGGDKQDLSQFSYFSNPSYRAYQELRKNGHVLIRLGELISTIREEWNKSKEQNS